MYFFLIQTLSAENETHSSIFTRTPFYHKIELEKLVKKMTRSNNHQQSKGQRGGSPALALLVIKFIFREH